MSKLHTERKIQRIFKVFTHMSVALVCHSFPLQLPLLSIFVSVHFIVYCAYLSFINTKLSYYLNTGFTVGIIMIQVLKGAIDDKRVYCHVRMNDKK